MKKTKKLNIVKRNRKEVLEVLRQNEKMWREFRLFPKKYQEELFLFCMGKQGLRTTYDPIFKYLFSPEKNRKRLEDIISSVLGEKVKIVRILQHEGTQMKEKGSFIIMDLVIELEDGRLLNVEMQKIGYKFPAERTDCYLADLVMRQYNDIKKVKGNKFNFKDMSKVMSIVIMEHSSKAFQKKQNYYIHQGKMQYDSGVILDDLFENIYISLDTYKNFIHTKKRIENKKEAWMLFLASTDLDDIMEVCEYAPEFIPLYQEVFDFGKDVNELVTTFTDALREMDRNEERYMVEELQEENRQQKEKYEKQLAKQKEKYQSEINHARAEIERLKKQIKGDSK